MCKFTDFTLIIRLTPIKNILLPQLFRKQCILDFSCVGNLMMVS